MSDTTQALSDHENVASAQRHTYDQKRLAAFAGQMRELTSELSDIFPERDHLVAQIPFALLTREHVLVHGVYGTGKTDLVNAVFNAFDGPRVFSIGLTKFMTESHVIGIPDPREMREEGVLRYQREGGILDAHFAELDEIFDASPPLLRILLGILNERHFKRGRQFEKADLHTAVASTNGDPETVIKQAPELAAVIDRFIFQSRVQYLESGDNRRKMYQKFVLDRRPATRMAYSDLAEVSNLVSGTGIVIAPHVIDVYDQVIEAYRAAVQKTRQVVSDRRACKLLKLVRASAVMHGRLAADVEDILAVRWGLCIGNDKAQHEAFKQAAEPLIDKAKKDRLNSVDQLCLQLLAQCADAVPSIPKQATEEQILHLYRQASALLKSANELRPQLPSTEDEKKKLVARLQDVTAQLNARLLEQQ